MRIRDWSSDVCSSDLDLDRRAAEQPLFQLMAGRAVCVRVFVEREPCLLLRLARQSQVAHGRDVDRLVAVEGADARQQITEREDALHPLFGRSEEHTSELQSLMRNSYAVHCLNKKK